MERLLDWTPAEVDGMPVMVELVEERGVYLVWDTPLLEPSGGRIRYTVWTDPDCCQHGWKRETGRVVPMDVLLGRAS